MANTVGERIRASSNEIRQRIQLEWFFAILSFVVAVVDFVLFCQFSLIFSPFRILWMCCIHSFPIFVFCFSSNATPPYINVRICSSISISDTCVSAFLFYLFYIFILFDCECYCCRRWWLFGSQMFVNALKMKKQSRTTYHRHIIITQSYCSCNISCKWVNPDSGFVPQQQQLNRKR